ncbi:MAG: 50S ribosomal protein L17 [Candidatus Levybacteria bacterium]|nr:50S ribosomal protein L17 [Candidatus Levybacteria bacterium]
MRKSIFGRKFKRDSNERKALFKSLMSELVLHGRIKTTEQKAKAIRASAEKLIKKAQKNGNLARKLLSMELIPAAMEKVITDIAPKFASRSGGYTRMVKLGRRFNDDASMVVMEWVEGVGQIVKGEKVAKEKKTTKSTIVEGEIVTEKVKKTVTKKARSASSGQAVAKKAK